MTSQTYLICKPINPTSSSVIEPARIGGGDNIWCLRLATTQVGSFCGVEAYSKTPSIGWLIVTPRYTRILSRLLSCGYMMLSGRVK